ncbi:MAG: hypothetical protein LUE24_08560 [Lachnospiraceae bacterium]|nr:hypothetical protein [Lachnospiraceae bacterium]
MKGVRRLVSAFLVTLTVLALAAGLYFGVPAVRSCVDQLYTTIYEFVNGTDIPDRGGLIPIDGDGSFIDSGDLDSLDDSGIIGDNESVDTEKYLYYSFLTSEGQTVYRQICANIEAMETTFIPETDISVSEMQDAIESVFNDHPEYFWIETAYSYRYTSNDVCVQITLSFNDATDDFTAAKTAFDSAAEEIISYAETLESDYEKEKYVHDAVIALVDYDESVSDSYSQSAYSALVMGRTVCAGYARAFQYIMQELDITTYYCVGYAGGDHAWNIVELSDGYYNVDLTWDDAASSAYDWFNLPDSVFGRTHTRTDLSVQLPSCEGTAYYNLEGTEDTQIPSDTQPSRTPDSETPDDSSSDETTPDVGSHDVNVPNNSNSVDTVPDNNSSEDTAPGEGETAPSQPDAGGTAPSQPDGNTAPQTPSSDRSPEAGGFGQPGGGTR